jgi:hypothetical protein
MVRELHIAARAEGSPTGVGTQKWRRFGPMGIGDSQSRNGQLRKKQPLTWSFIE